MIFIRHLKNTDAPSVQYRWLFVDLLFIIKKKIAEKFLSLKFMYQKFMNIRLIKNIELILK